MILQSTIIQERRVRVPDNIVFSETETDTCPFCGSTFPRPYCWMFGEWRRFIPYPCGCDGARAAAEGRKIRSLRQAPKRFRDHIDGFDVADFAAAIKDGAGLYITGPNGTGKTTFAHALIAVLHDDGVGVEVTSLGETVTRLRSDINSQQLTYAHLASAGVLVLDDLGRENPTPGAAETLFRIVNTRYERKAPIVITSNLTIGQLGSWLSRADVSTGKAVASRLSEMCQVVHMGGTDKRLA